MSNHTVVLAIFNDEISADQAAALLKESRLAKGDAIGVLALNEKASSRPTRSASAPGARVRALAPSSRSSPRSAWRQD